MVRKKIVVIGGGTGSSAVLSGLKHYPCDLTAIVAMADDGGSTGILRDELGVLPPGDVRQCLIALSTSGALMRSLIGYRFSSGTLRGHNFGNLLLSALEKVTGNFEKAVESMSEILRVRGTVIPATLDKTTLVARVNGRTIRRQIAIHDTTLNHRLFRISLSPAAHANPKALAAIRKADVIIVGPGDFYSSIVPNFLVRGIPEVLRRSRAKKIFVCNLMTRTKHTRGWSVADYTHATEHWAKTPMDIVMYNKSRVDPRLSKKYASKGEEPVRAGDLPHDRVVIGCRKYPEACRGVLEANEYESAVADSSSKKQVQESRRLSAGRQSGGATLFIGGDFVDKTSVEIKKSDPLQRSLVRHNPKKLAKAIARICGIGGAASFIQQ